MRRGWHRFLFTTDSEGPSSHSAQVGIRMRMRLNVHVSMCSYVHVSTCSYVHVSTCSYVHRGRGGTTFSGERPNGRDSAWASDFLWASMRASIGLCPASAPPSVPSPSRPIPLSPSPPSPLLRSTSTSHASSASGTGRRGCEVGAQETSGEASGETPAASSCAKLTDYASLPVLAYPHTYPRECTLLLSCTVARLRH